MSVTTDAKAAVGRAKRGIKREAAHQALRGLDSGGVSDCLDRQLDEARALHAEKHPEEPKGRVASFGQNVDLVGLAIALIIVGVVFYVGLNVMSTTEEAAGLDPNSSFYNASQELNQGISDAYGLSGILFMVLMLTGVVGLLLGLRGRRP